MSRRPREQAGRVSALAAAFVLAAAGCAAPGTPATADPAAAGVRTAEGASARPVEASPAPTPPSQEPARSVPVPAGALTTSGAPPGHRPVRLQVRAVDIDTPLIELGVAADGTMQVPTDYADAGWLDRSPVPGNRGPAVLAGHVDSRRGPAVFFRLRELTAGDRILVTRHDGVQVSFVVDGVQRYPKDAFPTAAVYGPVPGAVLRLVTCGGSFNRDTGHYRDNIVVFATATTA